ncbi:uncharacterized protein LOC122055325 [Zingiber officinale]|uniref:uncharacterized protein LOC122055325 n=1 Tax=Zingiber officinale TaxID=94328 RepID=UPI001C4C4B57|nr:uncharacterized protein LOC122055325 [Zingiber officinale]
MDFSWPEPEPATDYVGRRPLLTTVRHSDLLQRQTYLRSYQFTVRETFKGRVRRNLKEASKVGKAIVAEIIGRVFDAGLKLHKMNPLRCFRPCRKKFYLEDTNFAC